MYGKIFARTFEHSMMGKGAAAFAVLSYVIAKTVDSHITLKPDYLAFVIGEPEDRIREAIKFLSSPDPESTGKDHDGRRIVPIEDVPHEYFVPRHEHYRAMRTSDDVREATRERVRKFRAKKAVGNVPPPEEEEIKPLDAIYEAYPRKVGRPKALASIEKSVAKFGYEHVLEKTKAYAEARTGQNPQYTPNPETFFNQHRFNDDPVTWKDREQSTVKPPTTQKYGTDKPLPGSQNTAGF